MRRTLEDLYFGNITPNEQKRRSMRAGDLTAAR